MRTRLVLIVSVCLVGSAAAAATKNAKSTKMKYPETRRVEQTDEYFGANVPDPYRWLEPDVRESPEVADWVKKENDVARAYLDAIPQRKAIETAYRVVEL